MDFFTSNPLLLLAIGVVVVFVLMFIFVKPNKSKKKKTIEKVKITEEKPQDKSEKPKDDIVDKIEEESKEKNKSDEQSDDLQGEQEIIDGEESDVETIDENNEKKKPEKSDKKPKIEQIYKPTITEKKEEKSNQTDKVEDDNLVQRAQFVKSGNGKVSKLVGFSDLVENETRHDVKVVMDNEVQEYHENCEDCKNQIKHFDHSRRLSKMVKENNFDDLIGMHISDKYLNINVDKHVRESNNTSDRLFDMAVKTLSNSSSKVLVDSNGDTDVYEGIKTNKQSMTVWLEERKREELAKIMVSGDELDSQAFEEFIENSLDDIDLSSKNIFVVDAIVKRKGLKRGVK